MPLHPTHQATCAEVGQDDTAQNPPLTRHSGAKLKRALYQRPHHLFIPRKGPSDALPLHVPRLQSLRSALLERTRIQLQHLLSACGAIRYHQLSRTRPRCAICWRESSTVCKQALFYGSPSPLFPQGCKTSPKGLNLRRIRQSAGLQECLQRML